MISFLPYLAVFGPLVGFIIAFLGQKPLGKLGAGFLTTIILWCAAAASWYTAHNVIFADGATVIKVAEWVRAGTFTVGWDIRLDTLSTVMMIVVTTVSACVHLYSLGYMEEDEAQARFMSFLSLFTFMMMMLVTSDNLVQLFFGWEGVGVASYLLIGFWYQKPSAGAAAIKAFLVNRVGDIGLMLGLITCFVLAGTVSFDPLFRAFPQLQEVTWPIFGHNVPALSVAALLLFIGAMGKSAQLGLHTWLPDAMEGPTPVSALIHAATMVTAGVFLVARFSPLFEIAPYARDVVTVVGALTAFVAATIGMTQFDIKRVIAYSTMSQLGYMFFALGVGAYGAAMFHLVTHAFFKALLFLGAGSVIHALHHEQDMRNMGGVWKKLPFTYMVMWIGSLALAGLPFFAGYYSKDIILEAAFGAHSGVGQFAFIMGIAAAIMTAFYSWRLIIMTFHGQPHDAAHDDHHHAHAHAHDDHHHGHDDHGHHEVHEPPMVMLLPLAILMCGAIFSGYMLYEYFVGHDMNHFWHGTLAINEAIHHAHAVPQWVKILPIGAGLFGIAIAYALYMIWPKAHKSVAKAAGPVNTLFARKWFFDEIYDAIFVKPAQAMGRFLFTRGDGTVINGGGPDGIAAASKAFAGVLSRMQSGFVYHYALVMLLAVIALFAYVLWGNA